MNVLEAKPLLINPLDEIGDSARRARGINREKLLVVAQDMAFGILECGDLRHNWLLGRNFDSRLAQRPLLDLARRPDSDDPALIDDRNSVAQAFGLFNVVRCKQDG